MIEDKKTTMIVSRQEDPQTQPQVVDLGQSAGGAIVQQESRHKPFQQRAIGAEVRDTMRRTKEFRRATRYQLTSSATIRWLGADRRIHEAFGTVRDISICGLFVESPVALGLSTNVEVEITPSGLQPNASGPELLVEGRVVRTQKNGNRPGFAVSGFLSKLQWPLR
jgi:hypothetical protein